MLNVCGFGLSRRCRVCVRTPMADPRTRTTQTHDERRGGGEEGDRVANVHTCVRTAVPPAASPTRLSRRRSLSTCPSSSHYTFSFLSALRRWAQSAGLVWVFRRMCTVVGSALLHATCSGISLAELANVHVEWTVEIERGGADQLGGSVTA
eukprot:GHVU01205024.1.p1 GENE.GHVU01205024.1~~GHVU01205024.1.p1  ORF type:complete len:151 (-),score=2.42 GHVU01205024.1:53-505(-)